MIWSITQRVKTSIALIIIVGAVLPISMSVVPTTQAMNSSVANQETICINDPVPEGWIVVDSMFQQFPNCPPSRLYVIEKADPSRTFYDVCEYSPIPLNWVIVKSVSSGPKCDFFNIHTIEHISPDRNVYRVCSSMSKRDLPPNWLIFGVEEALRDRSGDCWGYRTYILGRMDPNRDLYSVCSISPLPRGWFVIEQLSNPDKCGPYYTEMIIERRYIVP